MIILRNKSDLNRFIATEAGQNDWRKEELKYNIRPKEYPCAVSVFWGEGSNGTYLNVEIVYKSQFDDIILIEKLSDIEKVSIRDLGKKFQFIDNPRKQTLIGIYENGNISKFGFLSEDFTVGFTSDNLHSMIECYFVDC